MSPGRSAQKVLYTERVWASAPATFSAWLRDGRQPARGGPASYSSPADLADLDAILDRYSDQETAGIRRILAAQRSR